ncbi:MAG: putative nucleotide-diphospho-sugar transferase [Acidobacteriota bacterium]
MTDMQPSSTRGVVYVAWGAPHVSVARRSAESVKRHNPTLKTAIWCAPEDDITGFDLRFDIPQGLRRPKVNVLGQSPFDETLFLDNDTLVRADLGSLFDLLQRFDMAGAQVILWHRPRHLKRITRDLPETFPEINTGVLLYRRNTLTTQFFAAWAERFAASGMGIDQPSFREVLWESDLAFHVLPPQFNKRVFEASELFWSDQPRPRILHLDLLRPQKNAFKRWLQRRIR